MPTQHWLSSCGWREISDGSPEEDLFQAMCANSMKLSVIKRTARLRPAKLKAPQAGLMR
jgi:hypothetical protein